VTPLCKGPNVSPNGYCAWRRHPSVLGERLIETWKIEALMVAAMRA
jgi:hypothetical protein